MMMMMHPCRELIDCTKNLKTPIMKIFLRAPLDKNIDLVRMTAAGVRQTTVADLVRKWKIVKKLPKEMKTDHVRLFRKLHPEQATDAGIMFYLDRDMCIDRGLAPFKVALALKSFVKHATNTLCSLGTSKAWWVFVWSEFVEKGGDERGYYKYISQKVNSYVLKGIAGIRNSFIERRKNGSFYIETAGSNLGDLGGLDVVNHRKCVSNDIHEIFQLYGIEAACNVINSELYNVMTADGNSICGRHIQQLTDTITHNGILTPMSRHGMATSKLPILQRASFEETKEVFSQAAVFMEDDSCNGVTDAVMLGKRAPIGTGIVHLLPNRVVHAPDNGMPKEFDPYASVDDQLRRNVDEQEFRMDDVLCNSTYAMASVFENATTTTTMTMTTAMALHDPCLPSIPSPSYIPSSDDDDDDDGDEFTIRPPLSPMYIPTSDTEE